MKSIRQRLTRNLLLIVSSLLAGGMVVLYFLVRHELIEGFDDTLAARAQAISTLVTLDGESETLHFSNEFMRGYEGVDAREFFEIWRDDGTSLQRSASLEDAHLSNQVGTFAHPAIWMFALPNGQPGRAFGVEFSPRGPSAASTQSNTTHFHLVVAARTRGLEKDLREILYITSATGLLMLGLIACVVPWSLGRALRPLEQLARETEKINAETLTLRFTSRDLPDELQAITDRLNALLRRLQDSFERERRVSAALAHELRTPIAELRNLAECALKWPEARDAETDHDALAIAQQMEAIVTQMLTLARSEAGQIRPTLAIVDLAKAIEEGWRPHARAAEQKGMALRLSPSGLSVQADPVLLRSIFGNLLENAIEYSPAHSIVAVSIVAEGRRVSLTFTNPAPELSANDVERFFERFWRKESARTGGVHAGLGLSLVQSFVRAHGWEISVRLQQDGRLAITISGASLVETSLSATAV